MLALEACGKLLTPGELAEILNVSAKTVYQMAELNIIPSLKIGGSVRFDPRDVSAWLESCKKGPLINYNQTAQNVASGPKKGGRG